MGYAALLLQDLHVGAGDPRSVGATICAASIDARSDAPRHLDLPVYALRNIIFHGIIILMRPGPANRSGRPFRLCPIRCALSARSHLHGTVSHVRGLEDAGRCNYAVLTNTVSHDGLEQGRS